MIFQVRSLMGDKVLCRGTHDACVAWIMERIEPLGDRRIYRMWTEVGETFYDVGPTVYVISVATDE